MAVIETVEIKPGKAGGQYWRIKAGNQWLSVFDKHLGQQLAPGKEVSQLGKVVRKGDFVNLEPFDVTENYDPQGNPVPPPTRTAAPVAAAAPTTPQPQPWSDARDASIQRQTCLKAAANIMAHAQQFEGVDKCAADVTALASRFLAWLQVERRQ